MGFKTISRRFIGFRGVFPMVIHLGSAAQALAILFGDEGPKSRCKSPSGPVMEVAAKCQPYQTYSGTFCFSLLVSCYNTFAPYKYPKIW